MVQKQVLKLDVSVSYTFWMTVLNALYYLPKYSWSIPFLQPSLTFAFQVAMQLSSSYILHDQYDIFLIINNFVELNDILVAHPLHQLNFSFHRPSPVWLLQLDLLVYFHSYLLISRLMETDSNDSICSRANWFTNDIVIQAVVSRKYHCVVQFITILVLIFFFIFLLIWCRLLNITLVVIWF